MGNLIRMDFYRLRKSRTFLVCLGLVFVLAVASAPLTKGLFLLTKSLAPESTESFVEEVNFSVILSDPFPLFGLMLLMISLCYFFYADVENGYVKNIAGQVPKKGLTIISKFIAAIGHNVIYALVGILGNVIGSLIVQRIVMDNGVLDGLRVLVLRLLLLQSLTAMLLLAVSTFRSKAMGMVLAVLFGLGLTSLIYLGINEALTRVFGKGVDITRIMPDSVMGEKPLGTLKALAVACGWGAAFLIPAVVVFDRKDVK